MDSLLGCLELVRRLLFAFTPLKCLTLYYNHLTVVCSAITNPSGNSNFIEYYYVMLDISLYLCKLVKN